MKVKILIILIIIAASIITALTGCEVFTIQGKKIVVEAEASYTQASPIGAVKIFITEITNENYAAAVALMLRDNGDVLTASQKHEFTTDLPRMNRFITGKHIKKGTTDTLTGSFVITQEYTNGNKAIFHTIEKNKRFYITSYKRE